jgi:hypothetical protein
VRQYDPRGLGAQPNGADQSALHNPLPALLIDVQARVGIGAERPGRTPGPEGVPRLNVPPGRIADRQDQPDDVVRIDREQSPYRFVVNEVVRR